MIQQFYFWVYMKELRVEPLRNIYITIIIAALCAITKRQKPKCPSTDEWINKIWYIHTIAQYLALKKKKIQTDAITQMNLEGIMLGEISQTEKNPAWCC